ncbi:hypothetical protein HDU93_000816, partial [Gonapodya sp. JEL0774]
LTWPLKWFNKSKMVMYTFLAIPLLLALLMAILNGISYAYIPATKTCQTTNDSINTFATVLVSFEIAANGLSVAATLAQFAGEKSGRLSGTMSKLSRRLITYPIITFISTFLVSLVNPNIPSISANVTYTASVMNLLGNLLKQSGGILNFLGFLIVDMSCFQMCTKMREKIAQISTADQKPWHRLALLTLAAISSVNVSSWNGRSTLKASDDNRERPDTEKNPRAPITVAPAVKQSSSEQSA